MAATNYMTKIYNIHRAGEDVDYAENVISASGSSQLSTSTIFCIGPVRYNVNGTLGGATVKLQAQQIVTSTASATFVDIIGTTADAAIDYLVDFPPFVSNNIKAIVASASSNSDFQVWIQSGLGRDIYD
jgi:hypothetical protein